MVPYAALLRLQNLGLNGQKVMKGADYNKIGELLGLPMLSSASVRMDDGILFSVGMSKGDQYHTILQLARVTGKSMARCSTKRW